MPGSLCLFHCPSIGSEKVKVLWESCQRWLDSGQECFTKYLSPVQRDLWCDPTPWCVLSHFNRNGRASRWLRKPIYQFLEAGSFHWHIHYSLLQGTAVPPGSSCKVYLESWRPLLVYWILREPSVAFCFILSAASPCLVEAALYKFLFSSCMFCWIALLAREGQITWWAKVTIQG